MIAKKIGIFICMLAMVCVATGTAHSSGYTTSGLWIGAIINTVEKGPVEALFQLGGEDHTARGDRVIWGHFYASPSDVSWGNSENPDVFVKIWFDAGGRIDVNFFHVSVPDIKVFSSYASSEQNGTTTMSRRYIRQYYLNGQGHNEEGYEDGNPPQGYFPSNNPSGYFADTNLRIGSVINTVEKGGINAIWRKGGESSTARGDRVLWGLFYASPNDVSWGSSNNPDLFVKIWFDVSGRVDVNFFHVSVPDIEVYSALPDDGSYDQKGTTILSNRYIRHEYQQNTPGPSDDYFAALGDSGLPANYWDSLKHFYDAADYVNDLPTVFDWRDKGAVTLAKDQGGCGSCWAFAAVGVLESKILINGGAEYDLSEQQQISCNTDMDGCGGGGMDSLKFWYNEKPMEENCARYIEDESSCSSVKQCARLPYHTTEFYYVDAKDIASIKTSLYDDGPAYFRFDVYSDFADSLGRSGFWSDGSYGEVYTHSRGSFRDGHAVLIIGWDDNKKAWLCKNSWGGSKSGPNRDGTFWMAYSGHARDLKFGMANVSMTGSEPDPNKLLADAGPDQRVNEGYMVILDASGSRNIGALYWEQIGGTQVTLSNDRVVKPSFIAPDILSNEESLTFRLTVTDSSGYQHTDTCVIQVVTFTAQYVTNFLGMTFNLIPAATFRMGSPSDEPGRKNDETLHKVTLTKPFYIQTTEVTQGQWEALMGENPSEFKDCGDDCPVEKVSWNDVQSFIGELNKIAEGIYRLPTEAEWEYAARAGSTTAFPNGGITETGFGYDPNLSVIGWYSGNSGKTTHPVAQKQANVWGLYDMHGNVYEWCQDWYDDYPAGSVTDPAGSGTGSSRVLRGGSWHTSAGYCRSAFRSYYSPGSRYDRFGFRLVVSPGQ